MATSILPPHAATLPRVRAVQPRLAEPPPHPATLAAPHPPHPATVAQRRPVFGGIEPRPPHPATVAQRRAAPAWPAQPGVIALVAQPMVEEEVEDLLGFIRGNVKRGLVLFSTACLSFAKASDTTVQEVQAVWYKLTKKGKYQLAVSANSSGHARNAVGEIAKGIAHVKDIKGYGDANEEDAKRYLAYEDVFGTADCVQGRSHAEQNLVRWIAPKLTKTSVFHIYGTKLPCSQCRPRLERYKGRLGYGSALFEFANNVGQRVEEDAVVDQIDADALDIPA